MNHAQITSILRVVSQTLPNGHLIDKFSWDGTTLVLQFSDTCSDDKQ